MNPIEQFRQECRDEISKQAANESLQSKTKDWLLEANASKYSYHFNCLGRPIIQYPQDMVAMQELIWSIKPDLILETGIAHGGSLIMSAAMLSLIDYCDTVENGTTLDPATPGRKVLGIDIDIRDHNREAIESHPMAGRIEMLQGSSIDPEIVKQACDIASGYERVLVCLDSNHTHEHALGELEAYAHLVSVGSYCVVFDTIIEDLPKEMFPDRTWGPGDNPKTAVHEYLKTNDQFEIDHDMDAKLLISVAPDGYLKRVK